MYNQTGRRRGSQDKNTLTRKLDERRAWVSICIGWDVNTFITYSSFSKKFITYSRACKCFVIPVRARHHCARALFITSFPITNHSNTKSPKRIRWNPRHRIIQSKNTEIKRATGSGVSEDHQLKRIPPPPCEWETLLRIQTAPLPHRNAHPAQTSHRREEEGGKDLADRGRL